MCTKILDKMTYHANRLHTEYGGFENYFTVGFGITVNQQVALQSLYFQNK